MSTKIFTLSKVIRSDRAVLIWLMIILGIAVLAGVVWMQADQVIAPPGLRLMDGLWRLFICRCEILVGPVHLI